MEKYVSPAMDVEKFDAENVVTGSNTEPTPTPKAVTNVDSNAGIGGPIASSPPSGGGGARSIVDFQ